MRLFSVTAFLTVSRKSEDSSPNTIRPLQSTTKIPSFVCVASFSCIDNSSLSRRGEPAGCGTPGRTHQTIACRSVLASILDKANGEPILLPSRIIVSSGS